jgi:FtsP/CotA-like multicopper oxidase with cupredoxin domain
MPGAPAAPIPLLERRGFLIGAGAAGMAVGMGIGLAYAQIAGKPDYSLRIAPLRRELAPGKVVDTYGYNGTVPGPVLRLREGQPVSIDISNNCASGVGSKGLRNLLVLVTEFRVFNCQKAFSV